MNNNCVNLAKIQSYLFKIFKDKILKLYEGLKNSLTDITDV